jgi:hypothetical protein
MKDEEGDEMGNTGANNIQSNLDFFFADPTDSQHGEGRRQSTLYLLRREVQDCLIGEVVGEHEVLQPSRHARRLFASIMVIFAGIDLLGKFVRGDDAPGPGEIERRFKGLIRAYMPLTPETSAREAHIIWRVRNTVMHSFGLYDRGHTQDRHVAVSNEPWTPNEVSPVAAPKTVQGTAVWLVSIPRLYLGFIEAVAAYEKDVRARPDLQQGFASMFEHYGSLSVLSTRAE